MSAPQRGKPIINGAQMTMETGTRAGRGATRTLIAALGLLIALAGPARAEIAFVVDINNNLFRLDIDRSGGSTAELVGPLTGLAGSPSEKIQGMDFRPATGGLYALSTDEHLYLIDPVTARVTRLHTFNDDTLTTNARSIDFDPRSDRLRIVSRYNNSDVSQIVNPDTFAITTNATLGGLPMHDSIVGIAYVPVPGSIGTTLYGVGYFSDDLYRIGNANDTTGASQAAGAVTPLVDLGVSFDLDSVGLDATATGELYMAATVGGQEVLFHINPATGATQVFTLIAPQIAEVRAFAIYSVRQRLHVVTQDNKFVTIDAANPNQPAPGTPAAPVNFTGLQPGEAIAAIDVRPSTGELYGFSSASRLYRITPPADAAATTATATLVGTANIAATSSRWEIDFDPAADRLRVARVAPGAIFIVNPNTAVVDSANVFPFDTTGVGFGISLVTGASPSQFVLDSTNGRLLTISGASVNAVANAAYLTLLGNQGFDISPLDDTAFYAAKGFLADATTLYRMNLRDAVTTSLGDIFTRPTGTPVSIRSLAVASPGVFRFASGSTAIPEQSGTLTLGVERVNGTNGPQWVSCNTQDVSASSPADYDGVTRRVAFAPGAAVTSCAFPIVDDASVEAGELFRVELIDAFGGVRRGSPASREITIVDNDQAGNAAPAVTITGPTSDPTYTATASPLTVSGTAQDLDGTIASVLWSTDGGASGAATITLTGPGQVSWTADVPLHGGPNVITITARDNLGASAIDELIADLPGASRSYYLAEGATGAFFDLDLLLVNPNADAAPITITFLREGGTPIARTEVLPGMSRRTLRVDEIAGLSDTAVSMVVRSDDGLPLVVERTMRWDATGYGAHTEKASEGQSLTWYFAEGAQGFFQTYLLLANPHPFPITASVEYLREGTTSITRPYTIEPERRLTVDAGTDPGLVNQSFGMVVTFSHPAAAERAMYFGGPPLFRAGHESAGVTAPSSTWFLAEGATGPFFETFVLIANPNTADAEVDVTFLPSAAAPVTRTVTVPARGRHTINIEPVDASLANEAVATRVDSTLPIVVERAQYWPDPVPSWYEAHNSFGVTSPGTRWGLAEGRSGGPANYQTYILLANPGPVDAEVTITYLPEGGMPFTRTHGVAANRRVNVQTSAEAGLANLNFGAIVVSTQPIAIERAMYADAGGQTWSAGTNATGTRLP
jgi:hypothetical protein